MAARAVANVATSLEHADLSDIIAGRPEAEALEAMRIISGALAQVQLRCIPVNPIPVPTFPCCAYQCRGALFGTSLRFFDGRDKMCAGSAKRPVAEVFSLYLLWRIHACLKSVWLSWWLSGCWNAGRSLNLSDNALGEKGVRACAAAISGQACPKTPESALWQLRTRLLYLQEPVSHCRGSGVEEQWLCLPVRSLWFWSPLSTSLACWHPLRLLACSNNVLSLILLSVMHVPTCLNSKQV